LVTYQVGTAPAGEVARSVTAATATTLTVAGTPWAPSQWVNETVEVFDAAPPPNGPNTEIRQITSSGPNTLTVSPAWNLPPASIVRCQIQGTATIYANLDADGLGPGGFGARVTVTSTNIGDFFALPAQALRGIDAEANLAWDLSGRTYNGRVYLVYTDRAPNSVDTDIYVRSSTDDGAHWSAPVKVNDLSTKSRFLPAIAVDQTTGNLGVSWYDARNDRADHQPGDADTDSIPNDEVQIFATVSTDGGSTFLPNVSVARAPSSSVTNHNSGNDFGDYTSLVFHGNSLYLVWTDNSTALTPPNTDRPNFDIATARVQLSYSDFSWDDLSNAYDFGVTQVVNLAVGLADAAFDVHIPLVQSGLSRALDIGGLLQTPFVRIGPGGTSFESLYDFFTRHGFTVEQCGLVPDGQGDLLRLSRTLTFNIPQPSFLLGGIGGTLGFSYFDDHVNGSLSGSLRASVQPITFQVRFGVDLVNNVPQLYLADTTNMQLPGVNGQARVSGTMNLRNLLNVDIGGNGNLNLGGSLGFRNLHPDHKLHLADFSPQVVTGSLNGSIRFDNVSLATKLPILPDLSWSGHFGYDLVTRQFDVGLNALNPLDVLKRMVTGLFSAKNGFNVLGPLADALNYRLPLVNWSVGEKLGIDGALGWLTRIVSTANLGDTFSEIQGFLNQYHVYIGSPEQPINNLNDLANRLTRVIQGDRVDLLTFRQQGGSRWETSVNYPLFAVGLGPVVSFDVGVRFGGYLQWDYKVGLGIDTTGFYIDPSTHIGIGGGLFGGINGNVRVFGFPLVSAEGRVSLNASASLSLRGPNPSSDRIYLDEIFRPGEDLVQSFLDALKVDVTLGLSAHLEAKLNLLFFSITVFSHDWNLARLVDLHIPLHTTQTKRTLPLNLTTQELAITPLDGVLTLDGSASTQPNLVLLSGRDGTVDVNWLGRGTGHYTNIRQVNFRGGSGDDRLQVARGFNIPINAQGGSGSNYFEAGDGDSTLVAGGRGDPVNPTNATLIGGTGRDLLVGGPGNNLLRAGSGDSTLIGGTGNATLFGGSGTNLLIGGTSASADDATTGNVLIVGGSGPSTIWAGGGNNTLVGGRGTSQIHGGRGNNFIAAGDLTDYTHEYVEGGGNDIVWGGSGYNTIVCGDGNDTVYGGSGRNTVRGGRGNNLIYGGPQGDLLMAGSGNDTIRSTTGNDTLVAGPGEDWLYGGSGDDVFQLPFGVVRGTVRSHFIGGTGRDTLAITTDDDDPYLRLTQSSATNFTVTSYAEPGEIRVLRAFSFDLPSDLHGNFIENLALQAIRGNNKLDVAPGVRKNVKLIGGQGDDVLIGGGGTNIFFGGTGNDLLIGGPVTGNSYNEFHGGVGNTTMIGGPGNDVFYGGGGDNDMRGGNGRVVMYGGRSRPAQRNHDWMRVGAQNLSAVMIGGQNDATMYGGPGKNLLLGGSGTVEMHAGDGDAVLTGGTGAATMYGGAGYDVLIGGQGDNVLYADDPTRPAPTHSAEDWQTRFDHLHDEIDDTRREENRLTQLLRNPNLTPEERAALQAQKDAVIREDGQIADAISRLDAAYQDPDTSRRVYNVPNMLIGGAGRNTIFGSTFANFILAGTGPTTIYSCGGDDTVTGTAGRDTFFIPPVAGNANVVFGAANDGHGNWIPKVTIDAPGLHQEELVHVRGIDQIGVITGAGNNRVTVDVGGHVLESLAGISVQCTTGNDRVELTDFPGRATVQAGSGSVLVLGGSVRGLELVGGSGSSIYEVDGNGVQVRAEGSPSMLSVYVNGQAQPRTKITRTTFRRLFVQGQWGTNAIVLGPLGGFSFPELIADTGPGNKTLDASQVSQRVTLLAGTGNDTLIGGSGPNYLRGGRGDDYFKGFQNGDTVVGAGGNDRYEPFFGAYVPPQNWTSEVLLSGSDDSFRSEQRYDSAHGLYRYGSHTHNTRSLDDRDPRYGGRGYEAVNTEIDLAHTVFTAMPYNPDTQGAVNSIDFEFDFRSFDGHPVQVGLLLRQGENYYFGWGVPLQSQSWQHVSASVPIGGFRLIRGSRPSPDFSPSGAPIRWGLFTSTSGSPQIRQHPESHYDPETHGVVFDGWMIDSQVPTTAAWCLDAPRVILRTASPVTTDRFQLTASATVTAGTPFSLTLTVRDAFGNLFKGYRGTLTFSSTDRQAGLPAAYTFTAGDNGQHTFSVILRTAGAQTVTAADTVLGFIAGSAAVTVLPATASRFDVSTPANSLAGLSFRVTVTASDPYGNIATGYTGTVHFTSDDGQAILPGDYQFTTGANRDNGIHAFDVTLKTAGPRTVTVSDTITSPQGSARVIVTPAAAASFRVTGHPSATTAGVEGTFIVTALDPFGNIDTGYRGAVHFSSSDSQAVLAVLEGDYRFLPSDNGVHTFRAALKTAGSQSITATDTQSPSVTGSQTGIAVTPAAADHFRLDTPTTVVPNVPFDVTVTALDPYGNIDVNYRGTVHFMASDAAASVPDDYAFTGDDQGVHTFAGGVTLVTAGDQVLTIGDTVSAITGSSTVTVSSGGGGGGSSSGGGAGGAADGEETDPFVDSQAETVASARVIPSRPWPPTTTSGTNRIQTVMHSLDLASVDRLFAATAEANHRTRLARSQPHPFDLAEDGWWDLGSEDNARLLGVS
jgi:Ca2+-binding RTX toxin-like protein